MSGSSDEAEPNVPVDAFSRAVQKQDKQTLECLLKKRKKHPVPLPADGRNWTALHLAASDSKYEECLELILRYGDAALDLDAFTMDEETPLFIACRNGCSGNVLLLLKNGCEVQKISSLGRTALHIAASEGRTKIVEYLLGYSVNVDLEDEGGFRPLHEAAKNGHLDICHILSQKGACVRSLNKLNQLPLHLACLWGHFEVTSFLFECDFATINLQNKHGLTPFMYAVIHFGVSEVLYLLENGAEIDIFDRCGKSALHYAIGNTKVFEILLERINFRSFESKWLDTYNDTYEIQSLLSAAIDNKKSESVNLLFEYNLPRRILEMPVIFEDKIFSPVACILIGLLCTSHDQDFIDGQMKYLESGLKLLVKHELMLDKCFKQIKKKYPNRPFTFYHPFSDVFNISYGCSLEKQLHYFNMLNTNGVTTDYCLQCYHDNRRLFGEFVEYKRYYEPVLSATANGNLEAVELFLANSVILEPDILLIMAASLLVNQQIPFGMYDYLTLLKPNSPFSHLIQFINPEGNLLYPYFNAKDRFSRCTLLQLCRTAVRKQLRGRTLEDNLTNFRRKIFELPIPFTLKEYLLFKS